MKKIFVLFGIMAIGVFAFSHAYAQGQAPQSSIIADVNLVNQVIVKQEGRLFTLGVNIQNKIGTQEGVMYGVQTYQTVEGKRVLMDEFAILDPLTIKQNEYAYKEFAYPLPTSIGGAVELFAFLKTDKGILLSVAPLGNATVVPVSVAADLRGCAVNVATKTFSCTVANKTNTDQNVIVVTQAKQGDSVFAPIVQAFTPQVVLLKAKEEKVVTETIDNGVLLKNAFFETILLDQKDSSLVERTTVSYVSPEQLRSIDNVLIEQTSAREYTVKIISLGSRASTNARVDIMDGQKICASQDVVVSTNITPVTFNLKKACDTSAISVSFINDQGSVTDSEQVTHKTLFPEDSKMKMILLVLTLVVIAFAFVTIKNRKTPMLKA